ncbi:hypothetical protein [Castellaniella sp.]|uniref:hypothetical protein n=1 Tax=Castellaniella sp. TaxID=1955812 RepID=UPI003C74406C
MKDKIENTPIDCLDFSSNENRFSQGDVIAWKGNRDYLKKAAIVVTADCDLAKGKNWGRVTVVPLIPATDYFKKFYIPKQLEKLESALVPLFADAIQKSLLPQQAADPTSHTFETLLGVNSLPSGVSSPDAVALHSLIRKARGHVAAKDPFKTLDEALLTINAKTNNLTKDRITNFINNPPGDCIVLPRINGLGKDINIAFLRLLRELQGTSVSLKTSQEDEKKGRRIGRLIPVLRYRLTQTLAQVFSDIGLPDSYESELKKEKNIFLSEIS